MPKRLLLVEDQPDIVVLILLSLQPAHFLVTVAGDLATARAVLAIRPSPDVVLLDIGLPDGSGLDLCRDIKAATPLLPVIVMTASEPTAAERAAVAAGADGFVPKPFEPDVMSAAVERLIGARA